MFMKDRTIKVSAKTHDWLVEVSKQTKQSVKGIVAVAIKRWCETELFMNEVRAQQAKDSKILKELEARELITPTGDK